MGDRAHGRVFAACLLLLSIGTSLPAHAVDPASTESETLSIRSRPITRFQIGSDQKRFGPLEFVGGLEMVSPQRDFGSLSAFRFLTPGGRFMGVADTGFWFFGRIERDAEGRPAGIGAFTMQQMVDRTGTRIQDKEDADAESLTVDGDVATVGFERNHRIVEYDIREGAMGSPRRSLDFLIPRAEIRDNRGFEALARAPASGPLAGARVVVTEKSLDKDGNIFAAILEGPRKGIFKVRRIGEFDITDGAFLPDGDLLLLERSYSVGRGVAMRLRRIDAARIEPGAVADGDILMEATMRFQIDNMEGLDVWQRADGATMVSLISDDNHSLLQRNLYLEFRLVE